MERELASTEEKKPRYVIRVVTDIPVETFENNMHAKYPEMRAWAKQCEEQRRINALAAHSQKGVD